MIRRCWLYIHPSIHPFLFLCLALLIWPTVCPRSWFEQNLFQKSKVRLKFGGALKYILSMDWAIVGIWNASIVSWPCRLAPIWWQCWMIGNPYSLPNQNKSIIYQTIIQLFHSFLTVILPGGKNNVVTCYQGVWSRFQIQNQYPTIPLKGKLPLGLQPVGLLPILSNSTTKVCLGLGSRIRVRGYD